MQKVCKSLGLTLLSALMVLAVGCTKPDRTEEANRLRRDIQEKMFKYPDQSLARVDSAEQVGLFSPALTNLIRANLYAQMGKTRLATFYGEHILHDPELKQEGTPYYSALLVMNSLLERNGEWGKAIRLSDELIVDVDHELQQSSPVINEEVALRVKSRAMVFKGDCEKDLGHIEEAERFYLEGVNLMMEGVPYSNDYWVIDALVIAVLETAEFYLEVETPEKALPLVAKADTALARLQRCSVLPELYYSYRYNNLTINKALIYAANGQFDQAEALYQKHRQGENLAVYDLVAEARYLTMAGRYEEALRRFQQSDSLYQARGSAITSVYIANNLMAHYKALKKAGRMDEVLAMADRMRLLTDSIHVVERNMDVEQQQQIRRIEQENISRRQSVIIHRIVLMAAVLVCLLIAYLLWRSRMFNKALLEKNRRLLAEIEQREQEQKQAIEQLKAESEEQLTSEQQLYRRICMIMTDQQPYTDETLNRESLATLVGSNAKYVELAIRECSHGENVSDFINRYRLEHAARLLKSTDDPIALVGDQAGIPSRATLARLFRNAYGMTCTEYRQAAQAEE